MFQLLTRFIFFISPLFKTRFGLQTENLALRHQLCIFQRSVKSPKIRPADRVLWSLLSRVWSDWKEESDYRRGKVVAIPHVGGLHHHYEREAA